MAEAEHILGIMDVRAGITKHQRDALIKGDRSREAAKNRFVQSAIGRSKTTPDPPSRLRVFA